LTPETVAEAVWKAANLGTPLLATGIGQGKGILIEAVLAFFLVFTVFATLLDDRHAPQPAGLIIGSVLAFDILVDEAGYARSGPNLLLIGAHA